MRRTQWSNVARPAAVSPCFCARVVRASGMGPSKRRAHCEGSPKRHAVALNGTPNRIRRSRAPPLSWSAFGGTVTASVLRLASPPVTTRRPPRLMARRAFMDQASQHAAPATLPTRVASSWLVFFALLMASSCCSVGVRVVVVFSFLFVRRAVSSLKRIKEVVSNLRRKYTSVGGGTYRC